METEEQAGAGRLSREGTGGETVGREESKWVKGNMWTILPDGEMGYILQGKVSLSFFVCRSGIT